MKTKQNAGRFLRQAAAAGLLALAAILPAQADYSNTVMSLNPVGYWRLNEPAGSGTAINIGSAFTMGNAAYIASPTLQQPGAMGTDPAVLFDGASQYASVPYNAAFNPPGSFTVGFWALKTAADNNGTKGAIFSRDPADSGQNGWLFFASNGDGKWWFRTYTSNTRANAISSNPIVLNQWTYVVGVHDATDTGTNYLYVNGVLAAPPVGNAGYTPNASFPMFFAAWADTSAAAAPGFFFPGQMDEIAFFAQALTPAQIHDLYVAAEYPPRIVEQPSAPSKIYVGDPLPITLTVVVENVSATPETYQWTKNGAEIPGATTDSLALGVATTNTSGNYAVVVSNPNGTVTSVVVPISVVVPPPGRVDYANRVKSFNPVAYYRLNDGANATTATNAGSWSTADGTYNPGATGGEAGVPYSGFGAGNFGARFAGTAGQKDGEVGNPLTPGSSIQVPAQSGIVEEMTIACWVKRNGDNMVWRGLVTQRDGDSSAPSGAGNGTGLTLGADNASPNQGAELRMLWNKGDVWWQWSPQLNTPNQQWAFCAVVFSTTNRTIYLNTRQASQTVEAAGENMPQTPHDWAVNPIFIGYDARGPYYGENSAFNGSMDEVAIFNRALTSNEIMQIYEAAEVPPIILVQPQAPPPPVYEGMMLSLSVVADEGASASPLAYQWTKNGTPISGQTTANLTVSSLVTSDTGSYAVVVTNTFGAVTSSVVALTVLSGPPLIAQEPQPLQRYAGATSTFSITAYGSSPLSYQWSLNGTPISGATTSAYTIYDVRAADEGNYSVLVTNPYRTTNSVNAALTLLPATKLAAVITERTPLGYWRLDETSGTAAYDYMGGRNGTLSAGVANNVPGPEPTAFQGFDTGNKAYSLNGAGGYVTVPSFGQINGAMTIVAWIKPDAVQSDYAGLVFTRGGGGDTSGLDFTRGGELGYHWNDAAASYNWTSGLYPTADQWNFVALVVEPTQATLYLDGGTGMQSGVNTLNHGVSTWSGVRFGSDSAGGRDYKGSMDDVAVYAYALSAEEIENIRKAGINGIYTPAKTFRWKGTNGADWSVAGNWNNTVPGASDVVVLSDSSTAGATVNLNTDVTVGGLKYNNKVANQTISSTSGKTLTLSGGGVEVPAGTLSIACPIDATANGLLKSGSGVLNIAGPMQVTYQPPNAWVRATVSGITLSGTGSWTAVNDFSVMNVVGTVTVNDSATLDWSSGVAGVALSGGDVGILVQNGGLVKGQQVSSGWWCCSGPGLILGSVSYFGAGASDAEYDLNGGILQVASIYNIYSVNLSQTPGPPNGSAVFRFNGGILRATQSDSIDPEVVKEGCTNLMGYLSHAYVGLGGARIDVATFSSGINQALEHDPALGATPDGGLRAMSTGGPGTLALYKLSSFTGPLAIDTGVTVKLGYAGDQQVAGVSIGGVDQGTGTFGVGHKNPNGVFTGTGTVTVSSAPPPPPTLPAGSFSIATGGVPTFTDVPTTAGYTYWLTYKDDLTDATWTRIGAGTAGGGNKTFTDTVTPYPAYRFYRLEVQ